jgi:hypothetical protein
MRAGLGSEAAMHFYRITDMDDGSRPATWAATMGQTRAAVRAVPAPFRACVLVHLVDVKTDKAGMLQLLATGAPVVSDPLRTWRGKACGGLREGAGAL